MYTPQESFKGDGYRDYFHSLVDGLGTRLILFFSFLGSPSASIRFGKRPMGRRALTANESESNSLRLPSFRIVGHFNFLKGVTSARRVRILSAQLCPPWDQTSVIGGSEAS